MNFSSLSSYHYKLCTFLRQQSTELDLGSNNASEGGGGDDAFYSFLTRNIFSDIPATRVVVNSGTNSLNSASSSSSSNDPSQPQQQEQHIQMALEETQKKTKAIFHLLKEHVHFNNNVDHNKNNNSNNKNNSNITKNVQYNDDNIRTIFQDLSSIPTTNDGDDNENIIILNLKIMLLIYRYCVNRVKLGKDIQFSFFEEFFNHIMHLDEWFGPNLTSLKDLLTFHLSLLSIDSNEWIIRSSRVQQMLSNWNLLLHSIRCPALQQPIPKQIPSSQQSNLSPHSQHHRIPSWKLLLMYLYTSLLTEILPWGVKYIHEFGQKPSKKERILRLIKKQKKNVMNESTYSAGTFQYAPFFQFLVLQYFVDMKMEHYTKQGNLLLNQSSLNGTNSHSDNPNSNNYHLLSWPRTILEDKLLKESLTFWAVFVSTMTSTAREEQQMTMDEAEENLNDETDDEIEMDLNEDDTTTTTSTIRSATTGITTTTTTLETSKKDPLQTHMTVQEIRTVKKYLSHILAEYLLKSLVQVLYELAEYECKPISQTNANTINTNGATNANTTTLFYFESPLRSLESIRAHAQTVISSLCNCFGLQLCNILLPMVNDDLAQIENYSKSGGNKSVVDDVNNSSSPYGPIFLELPVNTATTINTMNTTTTEHIPLTNHSVDDPYLHGGDHNNSSFHLQPHSHQQKQQHNKNFGKPIWIVRQKVLNTIGVLLRELLTTNIQYGSGVNGQLVDAQTIIFYVLVHFIQEYCELVLNEITSLPLPTSSSSSPPPYETILKQTATLVTFAFSKLFSSTQDSMEEGGGIVNNNNSSNNLAILQQFYELQLPPLEPPPQVPTLSNSSSSTTTTDRYRHERKAQKSATYLLHEFKPNVLKLLQTLIMDDDYSLRDSACISLCSYIADMSLMDMMMGSGHEPQQQDTHHHTDFILNIIHACEKHVQNFVRYSMLISAITDKLQNAISSTMMNPQFSQLILSSSSTTTPSLPYETNATLSTPTTSTNHSIATHSTTNFASLLSSKYSPHFNRLFKHLFEMICVNRVSFNNDSLDQTLNVQLSEEEQQQHELTLEKKRHSQFVVCLFDAFYDSLDFMKCDTDIELIETFLVYAKENILTLIKSNSGANSGNSGDVFSQQQQQQHYSLESQSSSQPSDEISAFSTCINAIIRNTDRQVLLKLFEKHNMFIFLTRLLRMCSNHSNLRVRDCAVHTIGNMSNADLFDKCPFDVIEERHEIIPQDADHDLLFDFVLPLLERESIVSQSFYQEATLEDDATLKKKIIVYHNAVWSLGRVILNIQRKGFSGNENSRKTSGNTNNSNVSQDKFMQFLERISPKLMNIIRLFANRDFFTTEDVIDDITGYLSNVCITISYISFSRIDLIAPYFPQFGDSFIEHVHADSNEDLDEEKMAMCVAIFRMTEEWLNHATSIGSDDDDGASTWNNGMMTTTTTSSATTSSDLDNFNNNSRINPHATSSWDEMNEFDIETFILLENLLTSPMFERICSNSYVYALALRVMEKARIYMTMTSRL
ncbi:hypothetical protein FDP41_007094 [Naegleria fowleri]|uniref:Uncharacterized protein n=1 Tax=Naegleria fowleri TaxID=5763 RepID=A0A6A5B8H4_NAEFO|nr:uncharacterized protein FDP41_007094 [Naegleria fowleri]KAF0973707.1 hypothetical protein FDP41_007094 [Naegleria fowleri]